MSDTIWIMNCNYSWSVIRVAVNMTDQELMILDVFNRNFCTPQSVMVRLSGQLAKDYLVELGDSRKDHITLIALLAWNDLKDKCVYHV